MEVIDRPLYRYIYKMVITGEEEQMEDAISDFIAYKLNTIKITDIKYSKTYILNSFKNYCIDLTKYDKVIINDKISFRKKKEYEYQFNRCCRHIILEDDNDEYQERLNEDNNNIKKIEIIISYIKKLPIQERELFKQYYINNISIRGLATMYDIKKTRIYSKIRKYKEDIKNLNLICERKEDITSFIESLKDITENDIVKIKEYHLLLIKLNVKKYKEENYTIDQMIDDIKKEIK